MENLLLIFLFSLLFIITFIDVLKKDLFFGGVYFFLYVYTIFTQIGYTEFPELSSRLQAYFGQQVFYSYYLFVLLSFVFFYLVFLSFRTWFLKEGRYQVIRKASVFKRNIFYLLVIAHLVFMISFFVNNYDLINYVNASDQDFLREQGFSFFFFTINFKFMVFINLVLYVIYRLRNSITISTSAKLILILLFFELIIFLLISIKIGSRIDILALTISVCVFEIKFSFNIKKMVKIAFLVIVVMSFAQFIEFQRGSVSDTIDLSERILFKDYYPPSHILIAALDYDYVDPPEVFLSNLCNALFKLNYPYLQATVADLFNPGASTRSASYAFYIFSEGYLAFGWTGFIYNGLVVFMGLAIWRFFASSSNNYYNLFALAMISTQMVNIVRSQCSYFVKDLYLFFLPTLFLFYLSSGLRPRFIECKRRF